MLNVGLGEFLVFAIIAILILGPEKLPQAIRAVAKFKKKLDHLQQGVQHTIQKELELGQLKSALTEEQQYIAQLEKRLDTYLNKDVHPQDQSAQLVSKPLFNSDQSSNMSILSNVQQQHRIICLNQYEYFLVDVFPQIIPFQLDFLLVHLMNWRCFRC